MPSLRCLEKSEAVGRRGLRKVIHLCSASVVYPGPSVSRTRGEVTFPVPSKSLFVNGPRGLNLAWLTGWNLGGGLLPAAERTHPEAWESPSLRGQARRHRSYTPSLSQGPRARVQFPALSSRGRPQHHHSWPGLRVPRPLFSQQVRVGLEKNTSLLKAPAHLPFLLLPGGSWAEGRGLQRRQDKRGGRKDSSSWERRTMSRT